MLARCKCLDERDTIPADDKRCLFQRPDFPIDYGMWINKAASAPLFALNG
jgi:hypothetical protein